MTLVVSKLKGAVIGAVSDTGVVEHAVRLGPDKQLPKICILNPDLAVGFAGSPDLALRYLEQFPRSKPTFRATIEYFKERHLKSSGSVDFLVLFNRPSPKIIPIREGDIQTAIKAAWIGDHGAFEAFQKYSSRTLKAGISSSFEAPKLVSTRRSESHRQNVTFPMLGALRYVIIDPDVETVFGAGVAVNNVDGAFQYRSYAIVLGERPSHILVPPTFARKIAPELAELRDYAATCFVTDPKAARQAVAYHYVRGKLTHMYSGERGRPLATAQIFTDMNIEQFFESTKQEFGDWTGMLALRTAPPAEYGIPVNRWRGSQRSPGPYRRPG